MNYEDLLGWCDVYELSIEPIHTSALLRKYTHMLVVKRNGVRVDIGQVIYLAPQAQLGIADACGQLTWYRRGAVHRTLKGAIEAQILPFRSWLYELIEKLRAYLLNMQRFTEHNAALVG